MKISLNWIKDFIEVDSSLSYQNLVESITLSVCEVEGFEEIGCHLKDVVIAEVIEIQPHPNADKLSIVTVNFGKQSKKVVCGASNFKVGDKVPFAEEGTVLPGNFAIKKAVIRGVESSGMLCAEDELGFSEDHSGLMILETEYENGTPLDVLFPDQVDVVMEIDNKSITHRPDLWGHYGFARELGTIFRTKVKEINVDLNSLKGSGDRIIEVEVLAGELVPRFTGLSINQIGIAPSPIWLQHRLSRVGLRPINNMVDLTNYVMLEVGQPMHAFDAEQIVGGKLTVRLADNGTKLMTLYQKEVELDSKDMTICDANGASVVAGVIGGLNTGVIDSTQSVFLEAANWDPVGVRKTSTKIGLRTDACQRFEKSLDPELSVIAIQRAVELMRLTNPDLKICGELVDIVNKKYLPIEIETSTRFICRRLGKDIPDAEIIEILTYLGFSIAKKGENLIVGVPSHRRTKDVSIQEDLVEEIGRIHGFNNIVPKAPTFPIQRPVFNLEHRFHRMAKEVLAYNGFHEVNNYPLTCQKTEGIFGLGTEGIMKLKNPVADNQNQMRTSLLPHFSQTIFENQKVTSEFKVFEIGHVYIKDSSNEIIETSRLIASVSTRKDKPGSAFFQLKSELIKLFSRLQLDNIRWKPLKEFTWESYQHSNISADIYSGENLIGRIFSFSPEYMDTIGLVEDVCLSDLNFAAMFSLNKKDYKFIPSAKYPAVFFEISLVIPKTTYFQELKKIILDVDSLITKVDYLDVYFPKEYPDQKSVSISMEFRSDAKTLDSDEIKILQDTIVKTLADQGFRLRKG